MSDSWQLLRLQVAVGPDGDEEEAEDAELSLRRELIELDIEVIEPQNSGSAPPGSRAVGADAVGAFVLNLAAPQMLSSALAAIRSWLSASSRRSIRLKIGDDELELKGVSAAEQQRLVDSWLARNTPGA